MIIWLYGKKGLKHMKKQQNIILKNIFQTFRLFNAITGHRLILATHRNGQKKEERNEPPITCYRPMLFSYVVCQMNFLKDYYFVCPT